MPDPFGTSTQSGTIFSIYTTYTVSQANALEGAAAWFASASGDE